MFSYHSFLLLCPFWKSPFFCLFPISSSVLIILIHAFYLDIPLFRRYPFIFGIFYSLFVLPLSSNPIVLLYHLIMPLSPLMSLFSLRLFFYRCHLYPSSVLLYATARTLLFRFWNGHSLFVISALLSLYLCNLRCHSLMSSR